MFLQSLKELVSKPEGFLKLFYVLDKDFAGAAVLSCLVSQANGRGTGEEFIAMSLEDVVVKSVESVTKIQAYRALQDLEVLGFIERGKSVRNTKAVFRVNAESLWFAVTDFDYRGLPGLATVLAG